MEALLQYVFDQAMAINAFDSNGYMLKVNLFLSECSDYQNLQSLKEKLKTDPEFYSRCAAILGPHQPGITQPDGSFTGAQEVHERVPASAKKKHAARAPDTPKAPAAPTTPNADDLKGKSKREIEKARRKAEKLKKQLEDTLGIQLPDLPATPALPQVPGVPAAPTSAADAQQLLDFLLAP
jgi:hypothetical protein